MVIAGLIDAAIAVNQILQTRLEVCHIYNFSSFIEGLQSLALLPDMAYINTQCLPILGSPEFEATYYNQIFCNPIYYVEFVQKIVEPIYANENVILVVNEMDSSQYFAELLLNIIQERYKYRGCAMINTVDDFFLIDQDGFGAGDGVINAFQDIRSIDQFRGNINK